MKLKAVGNRGIGRDHGMTGRDLPVCGSQRDGAVMSRNLFDGTIGEETDAAALANCRKSSEILEGVESCLPRIAQDVAFLAAFERHSDQSVNRRADSANRFQFLIEYIGRHAVALKEIPIDTKKVAGDVLACLDFLDPINGGSLTFVE